MLLAEPHDSGALGFLEILDLASGLFVADLLLKRAPVHLVLSKTTEPGKVLLAFSGDVASVESAFHQAMEQEGEALLDSLLLPMAHEGLWAALGANVDAGEVGISGRSLLSLELFTVAATLRALDAALKAAPARVERLHLGDGYGGKGYFVLLGELEDLQACEQAATAAAATRLVRSRLIPAPDEALPVRRAADLRLPILPRDP